MPLWELGLVGQEDGDTEFNRESDPALSDRPAIAVALQPGRAGRVDRTAERVGELFGHGEG